MVDFLLTLAFLVWCLGGMVWCFHGRADDYVVSWRQIAVAGPLVWVLALYLVLSSISIKRRG
jgi:hypothetical protein